MRLFFSTICVLCFLSLTDTMRAQNHENPQSIQPTRIGPDDPKFQSLLEGYATLEENTNHGLPDPYLSFYQRVTPETLPYIRASTNKRVSIEAAWENAMILALTSNRPVGAVVAEFFGYLSAKTDFSFSNDSVSEIVHLSSRFPGSGLFFTDNLREDLDFNIDMGSHMVLAGRHPTMTERGHVELKQGQNESWMQSLQPSNVSVRLGFVRGPRIHWPLSGFETLSTKKDRIAIVTCYQDALRFVELDTISGKILLDMTLHTNSIFLGYVVEPTHNMAEPEYLRENGGLHDRPQWALSHEDIENLNRGINVFKEKALLRGNHQK